MMRAVVNTAMKLRVLERFVSQKNVVGSLRCSPDDRESDVMPDDTNNFPTYRTVCRVVSFPT